MSHIYTATHSHKHMPLHELTQTHSAPFSVLLMHTAQRTTTFAQRLARQELRQQTPSHPQTGHYEKKIIIKNSRFDVSLTGVTLAICTCSLLVMHDNRRTTEMGSDKGNELMTCISPVSLARKMNELLCLVFSKHQTDVMASQPHFCTDGRT